MLLYIVLCIFFIILVVVAFCVYILQDAINSARQSWLRLVEPEYFHDFVAARGSQTLITNVSCLILFCC